MGRTWQPIGAREVCADLVARRSRHGGYGLSERTDLEKEYTKAKAEVEFLMAMRDFMSVNHCRFPQFTDCLAVLLALGYRRPDAEQR